MPYWFWIPTSDDKNICAQQLSQCNSRKSLKVCSLCSSTFSHIENFNAHIDSDNNEKTAKANLPSSISWCTLGGKQRKGVLHWGIQHTKHHVPIENNSHLTVSNFKTKNIT